MEFSDDAHVLCSVFTQYRNSINIYTEDEARDKKFYTMLLHRLMQGTGITIKDVTPLGSCRDVIEACSKDKSTYPKLYIVDGDIDLMASPKSTQSNLYVLDRYCIENYVIDESAILATFDELDYEHETQEIYTRIDYPNMINAAVTPMMELFHHFAMSKRLRGNFKLKHFTQICTNTGEIDNEKVSHEKHFVKELVKRDTDITDEMIDREIQTIKTSYPASIDNFVRYVSGKDYIIPYIVSCCTKKLEQSIGIPKESWKYQFAKHCDISSLGGLKEKIIEQISAL